MLIDPDCVPMKVRDLRPGDMVDLQSCPYLYKQPSAPFEKAIIVEVVRENEGCWVVYYENVAAGYDPDQVLMVTRNYCGESQ